MQSLKIGLSVNAISVDSAANSKGFDSKTATLFLDSEKVFGVVKIDGKRYDSFRGVFGFEVDM